MIPPGDCGAVLPSHGVTAAPLVGLECVLAVVPAEIHRGVLLPRVVLRVVSVPSETRIVHDFGNSHSYPPPRDGIGSRHGRREWLHPMSGALPGIGVCGVRFAVSDNCQSLPQLPHQLGHTGIPLQLLGVVPDGGYHIPDAGGFLRLSRLDDACLPDAFFRCYEAKRKGW